jgi:hypothetical protein
MNLKSIFKLFIISLLFLGCSKEYYFKRDQIEISKKIKKINQDDQNVRHNLTRIEIKYNLRTFETVVDSLSKTNATSFEGVNLSNFKSINYQLSKMSVSKKDSFQLEYENAKIKMRQTDSINRTEIKKIIKKYGFVEYYNSNWKNDSLRTGFSTAITHIPRGDEMENMIKLVVKEYKKGRVHDDAMRHMLWDYNDRKGLMDTIDIKKQIKTIKL